MKQLFLKKGNVEALHVPTPKIGPNDVLVKVHYSFISSGTEGSTVSESKKSLVQKSLSNTQDKITKIVGAIRENGITGTLALIKGTLNKNLPLGYSCSGEVVQVGILVDTIKVGDFVACAGAGLANHAEYVAIPKNLLVKLKSDQHLKQASLTTIGAIALQGVRRANLQLGEKVCVIGLGLIGQLTAQLVKLSGCSVYGVDIDDAKLFLAEKLGCNHLYNGRSTDIVKEITFKTEHRGVDTTIITAASPSGEIIQKAMEITRRKGKVVLVGDVKIDFQRSPFYEKEIDFLISCSYGPGRYDKKYEKQGTDYPYAYVRWTENRNMKLFASLVEENKIAVEPLISREFTLDQAGKAYETLTQKNDLGSRPLGLVISYPDAENEKKEELIEIKSRLEKKEKETVKIAFIGAGGFAKTKLLPIISKLKATKIQSIVDLDPVNAINAAQQYEAEVYDNDYQKVVSDKSIDMAIIATPHAIHAEQAIACMKAGKSVFVEKPAATTEEQLAELEKFLSENKEVLYCVDFNRSFAPFIQKIKTVTDKRSTPLVAHYRMNAGFLNKDHWVQSNKNGGRIIGEACHIFELFNFLTNSTPKEISVNTIETTHEDLLPNDNFSVQISFHDGSLCTLLYTALGSTDLPKEYMELFFDGKSIVMNDFKELKGYGLPRSFDKKTKHPDKGHKNLLEAFVTAVKKSSESPISRERILLATQISLAVNKQAIGKE